MKPDKQKLFEELLKKKGIHTPRGAVLTRRDQTGPGKLSFAQRRIFLDNDTAPEKIAIQFKKLINYARRDGEAVGIAHPHEETFHVLARELPKLRRRIHFVPASYIVHILR